MTTLEKKIERVTAQRYSIARNKPVVVGLIPANPAPDAPVAERKERLSIRIARTKETHYIALEDIIKKALFENAMAVAEENVRTRAIRRKVRRGALG